MLKKLLRLQWQMTLAFATVSFLVTVALEVLAVAGLATYFFTSPNVRQKIATGLSKEVQKHAPALESGNLKEIQTWLAQVRATAEPLPGVDLSFGVDHPKTVAAVADRKGIVLAGYPESRWTRGREADFARQEAPLVLWQGLELVASVPIRNAKGKTVGYFYYHSGPKEPGKELWELFTQGVLPSALVVTVCAGLAGGIAGAWVSRRVARRLNTMASAADAWAEGDFTWHAPESADELGQLARRLNRMARDLQDRMALQQDVATLEERQRLARDLHDTVKQQVFATALQVSAARDLLTTDPEGVRECLDTANELAQQTQKELTAVLTELRPVSPGRGSLPLLLQSHTQDWSRRSGIAVSLDLVRAPHLSDEASNALLRLTQEALSNVAKHSRATEVQVSLGMAEDRRALLRISDNGVGFSPVLVAARPESGLGLSTMRERAEALPGGSLTLISAPGQGTRITVFCAASEVPS